MNEEESARLRQSATNSLQRFIDKVKRVTQLTELTPEIVHEFIEKIVISKPEYIDGKRHQSLEICYNGVGIVREPSPEEMEELFQKHLQNRKSILVESTGTYYNKGEEKGGCYYGESV